MVPLLVSLLPFAATLVLHPLWDGQQPLQNVGSLPMIWHLERQIDSNGFRRCVIRSLGSHVTATLSAQETERGPAWLVVVGVDNTPNSIRYLRIKRTIYQTDKESFGAAEAEEIVEGLKRPGEFVFEWAQGPNAAKRGGLFNNGDFAAKAADCENWLAGTRT